MKGKTSTFKVLTKLQSNRRNDIIDALYHVQSVREVQPRKEISEKVLELISHSDADIRELAASTAGIYLQLKEASKIFLQKINLKQEKDQLVLGTISAALSTLVINKNVNRHEVNLTLVSIVLNEDFDPELRGTAYLSLLRINNKITVKEYAASSCDLERMNYDHKWVFSLSN